MVSSLSMGGRWASFSKLWCASIDLLFIYHGIMLLETADLEKKGLPSAIESIFYLREVIRAEGQTRMKGRRRGDQVGLIASEPSGSRTQSRISGHQEALHEKPGGSRSPLDVEGGPPELL